MIKENLRRFYIIFKLKLLLIVLFFSAIFPGLGFCQYANLDGRYGYIRGPAGYDEVGVALNKTACDKLVAVLNLEDKFAFQEALNSYNILKIKNNTPAFVQEVVLFEGKAKVLILDGLQRKFSGWIPLAWLRDNQNQPVFSKTYQFVPYQFSEEGPISRCYWGYK